MESRIEVIRELPERNVLEMILILKWCRLDGKHKINDKRRVSYIKKMGDEILSDIASAITVGVITSLPWKEFSENINPRDLKRVDYFRALMLLPYGRSDFLTVHQICTSDEKGLLHFVKTAVYFVEYITTDGDFEL